MILSAAILDCGNGLVGSYRVLVVETVPKLGFRTRARARQFWIASLIPVYNTLTPICDGSIVAELAQTQCSGSFDLRKNSSFHLPTGNEEFIGGNPRHLRR